MTDEKRPYPDDQDVRPPRRRTRLRITESAVDLHGSIGPARTSMSAVAEQGRGAPSSTDTSRTRPRCSACTAHWNAAEPPPDPRRGRGSPSRMSACAPHSQRSRLVPGGRADDRQVLRDWWPPSPSRHPRPRISTPCSTCSARPPAARRKGARRHRPRARLRDVAVADARPGPHRRAGGRAALPDGRSGRPRCCRIAVGSADDAQRMDRDAVRRNKVARRPFQPRDAPRAPRCRARRRLVLASGLRAGRTAIVTHSPGLARAEERARALAAARGVGLQPLAALRRGAPLPRAGHHARGSSGSSCATTTARSPSSPRATGTRARRSSRRALVAPRAGHGQRGDRCASCAPRGAHDHAGAPRPAPVLPLAAPVRDPERRAGHLRRDRRRVPRAAPHASSARWRSAACTAARPATSQALSIAVLRERDRRGHRRAASMSARAGRILLRRQLSQLPRWLDQARYNGPPRPSAARWSRCRATTRRTRRSRATGASSPTRPTARSCRSRSSSARSRCCAPTSTAGTTALVSRVAPGRPQRAEPRLGLQPVDLRRRRAASTYETSAGNQNFAKRYGQIGVLLCDLHGAATATGIAEQAGGPALADSKSAYNPVISADGRASPTRRCATAARASSSQRPGRARASRRAGARRRRALRRRLRARAVGRRHARRATRAARARGATRRRDVRGRGARPRQRRRCSRAGPTAQRRPADGPSADGRSRPTGASSRSRRRPRASARARQPGPVPARPRSRHARCASRPAAGLPLDPVVAERRRRGRVHRRTRRPLARSRVWNAATGQDARSSAAPSARPARWPTGGPGTRRSRRRTRVAFASTATNLGAAARRPARDLRARPAPR